MSPAIPIARYTSAAFHALEEERLWPRAWLLAGLSRDLSRPGDWIAVDIGRRSVVVARSDAGLRAFHNRCAHRARRLCAASAGHDARLVCPYHRFEWGLDGALRDLPLRELAFPDGVPQDMRLTEVRCAQAHGLVFVCMDEATEDLPRWLEDVDDLLARAAVAERSVEDDASVEVPCNWKACADAFNESYHLPAVHPQLAEGLESAPPEIALHRRHSRIALTLGDRFEQLFLFPNVAVNLHPGGRVLLMRYRPHATDPGRCHFDQVQLVPEALAGPRARRRLGALGDESLGEVTDQDLANLAEVQRGMAAGEGELRLSALESRVAHMHSAIEEITR